MSLSLKHLTCLAVCAIAITAATSAPWHPRDAVAVHSARVPRSDGQRRGHEPREHVVVDGVPGLRRRPRTYFARPDFVPLLDAIDYVNTTREEELFAAIDAELAATARYAASIPAPVRQAPGNQTGTFARPTGGGGSITQQQFAALNQCEASGQNGYRTGRYGIEAGYPIGGLSDAEQQAWVQRIYDQYGASAWGVLCRPILGG